MKKFIKSILVLAIVFSGTVAMSAKAEATAVNDTAPVVRSRYAADTSKPLVVNGTADKKVTPKINTDDKKKNSVDNADNSNDNKNSNTNNNNVVVNNTNNNKQSQKLDVKVTLKESDIQKIVDKRIAAQKKLPATGGSGALAISSILAASGSVAYGARRIFGIFS